MRNKKKPNPSKLLHMGALLTVSIGFFMVCLDTTVVNVALQSLKSSLNINISGLQWTVDSYVLPFAALLLSTGDLGDRIGPKRLFCFGLLTFSIASALCGTAPSLGFLLIARALQGIGSALLVATSLSLLQRIFINSADRARAFGIWGAVGGVAVTAGPVIGGFLVATFGWRSVFLLNIPFGIAGLFMASHYIPKMPGTPKKIKIFPQIASIIILGSLAYAFIAIGANGWKSTEVTISTLVFVVFTIIFIIVEIVSDIPMLPKEILRGRSFIAAAIVGVIINFSFYGQLFIMSLYFQQVRNFSTIETGFAFLPQAIACTITAFYCGRVTAKVGPGIPMAIGLIAGTFGLIGLALLNAHSSYLSIYIPMTIVGFGMSSIAPATVTAAMASASKNQSGVVSGIINAVRQSGSLMGVAVLGSIISLSHGTFTSGMHESFIVSVVAFIIGLGFTVFWILPESYKK